MYKVKMLCFEPSNVQPHEDEPVGKNLFETISDAYDYALKLAYEECDYLNNGAIKGVSFGVVEEEEENSIRVNYYYNEENDETGNTEQVTVYWVEEI